VEEAEANEISGGGDEEECEPPGADREEDVRE